MTEIMRKKIDKETFIHGKYADAENYTLCKVNLPLFLRF